MYRFSCHLSLPRISQRVTLSRVLRRKRSPHLSISYTWDRHSECKRTAYVSLRRSSPTASMERLQCVVQTYAWGKRGRDSFVAQLKEGADEDFEIHSAQPYAELWMGTHPNGPARIMRDNSEAELLGEWLAAHPEAAGDAGATGDLPFLFKVLSVDKALSIQAHPDLELARSLHEKFPDVYKDANHKPEMAIALTRFEALCQFRPIDEIIAHIKMIPELRALVGEDVVSEMLASRDECFLREYFRRFIHADEATVAVQIERIRTRLQSVSASSRTPTDTLVLRLVEEYDVDIGCFCPYLLNYITLEPGEAVFLSANEPHAYLSGDCIECMACSDNVVRAGLTPKFIDKATLYGMLTYRTGMPAIQSGEQTDGVSRVYSAPVPEFEVEALQLASSTKYSVTKRKGASILLVTAGSALARHASRAPLQIEKGHVLLIGAGEHIELEGTAAEPLSAFRAFPNEQLQRKT